MQTLQIAIDLGNFELKFKTPSTQPKAIRSARMRLTAGMRTRLMADGANPIVEVNDVTWHLGYRAFEYPQQQLTVEEQKTDNLLLHVLACIRPLAEQFEVKLIISHPTPEFAATLIKSTLLGSHPYSYNARQAIAHITSVEVVEESVGTFHYLKAFYPHLLPVGDTLLIDVGGGTVLTKILDSQGNILDRQDFERMGAYYLANRLSKDARLYQAVGTQPDIGLILNGIAEGTHQYGKASNRGITWSHYLDEYLADWGRSILTKCQSAYQSKMADIGAFLFTGGSSLLLKPRLDGKNLMVFSPELRFANVLGMEQSFKPTLKAVDGEAA
jgi:hypothetical protein